MKILVTERVDETAGLGWAQQRTTDFHRQFSEILRRRCSPGAARLFARPEFQEGGGVSYFTEDHVRAVRYPDLTKREQALLRDKIAAYVGEAEACRQKLLSSRDVNDQNAAAAMDQIFLIPSESALWSVDGEPVVAQWATHGPEESDLRGIRAGPVPEERPLSPPPLPGGRPGMGCLPWVGALLLLLLILVFVYACELGLRSCAGAPAARVASNPPPREAPAANQPPRATGPLTVTLAAGVDSVEADVLSVVTDPEGGPLSLVSCAAPGRLEGGKALYFRRPEAPNLTEDGFSCLVADPAGASVSAPVKVLFTKDVAHCAPTIVDQPVKLIIGLDWSNSMAQPPDLKPPLARALQEIADTLPPKTDLSLSTMFSSSIPMTGGSSLPLPNPLPAPDLLYEQGPGTANPAADPALAARIMASSAGGPDFHYHHAWLAGEIRKADRGGYGRITVVTITDARDEMSRNTRGRLLSAMDSTRTPIEHLILVLRSDALSYEALAWPRGESARNHIVIPANAETLAAERLREAARLTLREGCEEEPAKP